MQNSAIAFGPVPSRRLGRSLGINNIPPKTCTYSCVYCQVGRTTQSGNERREFYTPAEIVGAAAEKIKQAGAAGAAIDYLTFVPDGEPTLDASLGREIELLRTFGLGIAVISNASLIFRSDVRADLARADWVSLKIDAVEESVWRRVNRPGRHLDLSTILKGALEFSRTFEGELVTETMLVDGLNDDVGNLTDIANYLAELSPAKAYLSIPTRPPSESWVRAPAEEILNMAFQIFAEHIEHVEYLIGYEGDAFASTGDAVQDVLGITAVHPMRQEAVETLFSTAGVDISLIDRLVEQRKLVRLNYEGKDFLVRRLKNVDRSQ